MSNRKKYVITGLASMALLAGSVALFNYALRTSPREPRIISNYNFAKSSLSILEDSRERERGYGSIKNSGKDQLVYGLDLPYKTPELTEALGDLYDRDFRVSKLEKRIEILEKDISQMESSKELQEARERFKKESRGTIAEVVGGIGMFAASWMLGQYSFNSWWNSRKARKARKSLTSPQNL